MALIGWRGAVVDDYLVTPAATEREEKRDQERKAKIPLLR